MRDRSRHHISAHSHAREPVLKHKNLLALTGESKFLTFQGFEDRLCYGIWPLGPPVRNVDLNGSGAVYSSTKPVEAY
jgi:hypothetical protein